MINIEKKQHNLYDYEIIHYADWDVLRGFSPEYNDLNHPEGDWKRGVYVYTSVVENIDDSGILPVAETRNTFYTLHEEKHPEGDETIGH